MWLLFYWVWVVGNFYSWMLRVLLVLWKFPRKIYWIHFADFQYRMCDCSSYGIWLYALFISAVVKYLLFIFVKITWIGSIGQLHLESSMNELRYLASRTSFNDSPFAKTITGFINLLPFGCSSFFTGEMISYCSSMSSNRLTLSCKWIGILLACWFLKTASGFRGKISGAFTSPTSSFDVA